MQVGVEERALGKELRTRLKKGCCLVCWIVILFPGSICNNLAIKSYKRKSMKKKSPEIPNPQKFFIGATHLCDVRVVLPFGRIEVINAIDNLIGYAHFKSFVPWWESSHPVQIQNWFLLFWFVGCLVQAHTRRKRWHRETTSPLAFHTAHQAIFQALRIRAIRIVLSKLLCLRRVSFRSFPTPVLLFSAV